MARTKNPEALFQVLDTYLARELAALDKMSPTALANDRYRKFRAMGSNAVKRGARMMGVKIVGTGSAVPSRVVTNDDLAQIVDTSDEWISTRTGIRSRRYVDAEAGESHRTLVRDAAQRALGAANIAPEQVGVCLVATFTADTCTPFCRMPASGRSRPSRGHALLLISTRHVPALYTGCTWPSACCPVPHDPTPSWWVPTRFRA